MGFNIIGNDWDQILEEEFGKTYFSSLIDFVNEDYQRNEIYPPAEDVFNALKLTSFADTKVVIVGQDPYINPGQAHGLSFSVRPGIPIPPSLLNIFKELQDDCGCFIPDNGCLTPWANQGVLLLNSVLTVRRGQSNSHANMGWEQFTNAIISKLNQKERSIIFMLWGNYARKNKEQLIDHQMHLVLTAPHPSPLAGGKFFGCKHFSKANQYLYEISNDHIDWQIPNIMEVTK